MLNNWARNGKWDLNREPNVKGKRHAFNLVISNPQVFRAFAHFGPAEDPVITNCAEGKPEDERKPSSLVGFYGCES